MFWGKRILAKKRKLNIIIIIIIVIIVIIIVIVIIITIIIHSNFSPFLMGKIPSIIPS